MMRWNSTKTYTEDDILRMQQEAVMRVHEFQSRARTLPFYDVPESAIVPYSDPPMEMEAEQAQEQPTLQMEEDFPAPQEQPMQEFPQEATYSPIPQAEPVPQMEYREIHPDEQMQMQRQHPSDPFSGLLSHLKIDNETLLILGLMFLLYTEKADSVLLVALAYLLL